MSAHSVVSFFATDGNIKPLYRRGRGERLLETAQTIGLNCGMTHCPDKIEYNCRYFIMSFRTQIHKKKFGKNGFYTLQGTMSHRPLTNSSSLKITAAYCTLVYQIRGETSVTDVTQYLVVIWAYGSIV
jgi:hypothetical protein